MFSISMILVSSKKVMVSHSLVAGRGCMCVCVSVCWGGGGGERERGYLYLEQSI